MRLQSLLARSLALLGALAACSSDDAPAGLAASCALNTDCTAPLVCGLGRCHSACRATRDCPARSDRCVNASATTAAEAGAVLGGICQSATELDAPCTFSSECPSPLKCAVDSRCRAACEGAADCLGGQSCVSHVCADANEIDVRTGDLAHTNAAGGWNGVNDDSGAGPYDASTSGGDSFPTNDSSVTAEANISDGGPCSIRFSAVALGDTKDAFTGGVGARTSDGLLLIDAYDGPGDDGGPSASYVTTQRFDLNGKAAHPAATAFVTSQAGSGLLIDAAATAPDGSTIVIYHANNWTLYVAFLTPALALAPGSPFVIKASDQHRDNQPDVQWVGDRFVVTWVFGDANKPSVSVAMFATDGSRLAGISPLPTDDTGSHVFSEDGSLGAVVSVGASNNVLGVAYRSAATAKPMLTLLDLNATPIGNPVAIAPAPSSYGIAVGGTNLGFAYLWHEGPGPVEDAGGAGNDAGLSGDKTGHITYVSTSGILGKATRISGSAPADYVRSATDGMGAGFAMHYPDGVRFGYAMGDVSAGLRVAPVFSVDTSELTITGLGGSFGVFVYSASEHRTRGVAEGCNLGGAE